MMAHLRLFCPAASLLLAAGLLGCCLSALAAESVAVRSVQVEGTAFRVTLDNGEILNQEQLPGSILILGDGRGAQRRIRIEGVERDPKDPAGEVVLYSLSEADTVKGEWRSLCEPDPDGRRLGFPLAGAFTADGRYDATHPGILLTCTGGAEGKCVRLGYKPWASAPNGASLAPYYQACVRLLRADYCGDGKSHTRDGTEIDIFDAIGIQRKDATPEMTFEAAWGPGGAVCVRHTRVPDILDIPALVKECPRLEGSKGRCDATVRALLFNRSLGR